MSITVADGSAVRPYLSLVLTAAVVIGSPGPATIGTLASATALGLPTATVSTLLTTSTLAVLIVLSHLAWAVAGAIFAAALRHPRTSRTVNVVLAAALVASTVPVLTELLP